MRLFSKEEIASLQEHVTTINKEYKEKIDNRSNLEISSERVKALNNLNRIISSKYR